MQRYVNRRRQGVTLIELLIVILIMLMITAITVPAIAPALEGRKVREAARLVEVYLNSARNRAIADGQIVGVRFDVEDGQPSSCISLSLVEQPGPWAGDFTNSDIAVLGNGGFGVWQQLPFVDGTGTFNPGIVSADPIFSKADIGWVGNIAPGDVFILGGKDMTQYRLFAGEPYIDVNGNGQWDGVPGNPAANEPYNDVDGNGSYTLGNPATIDPDSGMLIGSPLGVWPIITWGQPTAVVTYTFADPILAAKCMSPFGAKPDINGNYTQPIYLDYGTFNSTIQNYTVDTSGNSIFVNRPLHQTSIDFTSSGNPNRFAFNFYRRPIPLSSGKINLPDSACIDLGSNLVVGGTNIVGVPGSGVDMLVPFSGGSSTLGNYATFRPNPVCDHVTNQALASGNANQVNRSVMVTFDPSGVVDMVYSWDERSFLGSTTGITAATIPNFVNYEGRHATSPIYLLIGKRELIGGDPDSVAKLTNGAAPIKPAFNVQDPTSLWVAINPRTGLISSTENVAPNLTVAPAGTSQAQLQLYFNAQTYQARSIAREALDMGGM